MTGLAMQDIAFFLIGGLALFLFGLRFMSDALQLLAGDQMRNILLKGTKTPLRGIITGFLVTGLIQSSSSTTVLTVGLVNAGLLSLRQSIGVIMGANIGSIVTAFLIGFNIQVYALPIVGVGSFLFIFIKKQKARLIGQALLGFGLLFYGLTVMGEGMKPLKDLPAFVNMMHSMDSNTLWGVLAGVFFTGIIQSSSAVVGVLQQLAYQGAINYQQAIPLLFGANIGTTITALLASLGTSVAARRTALTHCLFNIIGTIIWLPLFLAGVFLPLVKFVTNIILGLIPGFTGSWNTINLKLQIAQTHAVFHIGSAILLIPLVSLLDLLDVK